MTKTNTVKTALAAVTLAAATFALPTAAQAGNYNRDCSDTENAILGGVVGGSLGTVIGEEIAGRGDKKEGAILGAIVGGIAGAAIGDGASDCEKRDTRYRTTTHYPTRTTTDYPARTTYGHTSRGYQTVGHRSHRNYGYNRGFSNNRLYQIEREIDQLRFEREQLKRERKYSNRYRPRLERRLDEIAYRLDHLKDERKRIKKYGDYRRTDYRRDYYQPRRGHYHGSSRNLCYSDH